MSKSATNKPKTYAEQKKSALSEALRKAIIQLKPKTPQELESIVQIIINKLEEKI